MPYSFNAPIFALLLIFGSFSTALADQFILFDVTFELSKEEADKTKSHFFVKNEMLNKATPKNWISPVDYRNGSLHLRLEVLEKPAGEERTTWSVCYIPNRGQKTATVAAIQRFIIRKAFTKRTWI